MNIVFFHGNGILPNFGGISRITDILGSLFVAKGNNVWYVGARDKHKGQIYSDRQSFLPSNDLFSEENIFYMTSFVKKFHIDVVINQCALDPQSAEFLAQCKKKAPFLLVSCFHNSILTPVLNGAYQKEFLLKKKGLGWAFHLMNTRLVHSLIVKAYILKHREHYLSTVNNSDCVVVLRDGQVPELYRMCGLQVSDKVSVLPNGIAMIQNEETAEAKEDNVVWVGTFDYAVKRPDNMLRIWKMVEQRHPGWSLQMLGDGPSWNEMRHLAQTLGLKHVHFEGRVVPDEYYRKAAIACVTSVHEAFSLVVLEAQRTGCVPVVNNSFTSVPMLIDNGVNGFAVEAFNNVAFANTLSLLMDNVEMRKQMSEQAIANAKRFSLDNVYSKWLSLFKEYHEKLS